MSDIADEETMDEIAVSQLHAGEGDGADMVFTFNGRLISVSVFPTNGSSTQDSRHLGPEHRPLQDRLVDLIARATECQDDEYEELEDEALSIILDAGKPHFSQLGCSQEADALDHPVLFDLLFPKILYFHLQAGGPGPASLIPIEPSKAYTTLAIDPAIDEAFDEELDLVHSLPRYTPEEIVVTELFLRGTTSVTAAVKVHGQDMFCKSRGGPSGLRGTSEGHELECLGRILTQIPETQGLRVPRLLGYIQHKETNQVLGFLRKWIPGRRLSKVDIATTAVDLRQKWISQIRDSIQNLHESGLVWGDGKPGNIIIDERDDAWLIDFGGGFTKGWVDEELAETTEGDEQALARIIKALDGDDDVVLS
jgi:hypothetical protein